MSDDDIREFPRRETSDKLFEDEELDVATHIKDYRPNPILRYFQYTHLQPHLAEISKPFCQLANTIDVNLPDDQQKEVALQKLLEAKDAAIRTVI